MIQLAQLAGKINQSLDSNWLSPQRVLARDYHLQLKLPIAQSNQFTGKKGGKSEN